MAVKKAIEDKRLRDENTLLRKQLFERFDFNNIVGEDQTILDIFERIKTQMKIDEALEKDMHKIAKDFMKLFEEKK